MPSDFDFTTIRFRLSGVTDMDMEMNIDGSIAPAPVDMQQAIYNVEPGAILGEQETWNIKKEEQPEVDTSVETIEDIDVEETDNGIRS